jgi:hypothetical protein
MCFSTFFSTLPVSEWTPGQDFLGWHLLRNYLALHSITLLINDETMASSIKFV